MGILEPALCTESAHLAINRLVEVRGPDGARIRGTGRGRQILNDCTWPRCDPSLLPRRMFVPPGRLSRPYTFQERCGLSGDANQNEDQCRAKARQRDKAAGNGRAVLRMRFGKNVRGSDVQEKPCKEAQIEHQHRPRNLEK
jgi:hypothetical protein